MHKLEREAEAVVLKYRHGTHKWGGNNAGIPNAAERVAIWAALDRMQNGRCAYCEVKIRDGARHIEHFLSRHSHPKHTFDWNNLFGSCDRDDSCGKYKDGNGKPYQPEDLIKPDVDDPDPFLLFTLDGHVGPSDGLSPADLWRAKETIRVFNLNCAGLATERKNALDRYRPQFEYFMGIYPELPELVVEEIAKLKAKTAGAPFATAIRRMLKSDAV